MESLIDRIINIYKKNLDMNDNECEILRYEIRLLISTFTLALLIFLL